MEIDVNAPMLIHDATGSIEVSVYDPGSDSLDYFGWLPAKRVLSGRTVDNYDWSNE